MYYQVRKFATYHSKIAVVGAGTGGISFTSKANILLSLLMATMAFSPAVSMYKNVTKF